jgi:glycosyltransferase involved in cell wall biosynthesis
MIKVLHVITALRRGGAEHSLKRLLGGSDRQRFRSEVVELMPGGALRADIEALGLPVHSLGITGPGHVPAGYMRLRSLIRREKPDIVQTWLYHADVLGTLARLPGRRSRLIWNIRNSGLEASERASWRLLTRTSATLSRFADCVVSNSAAGIEDHRRLGYRPGRWELIPNGWAAALALPSPGERAAARERFGLEADAFLIGFPARPAAQKDHATFFSAVAYLGERVPRMRFVLFGAGVDEAAFADEPALRDEGVRKRLVMLGELGNVDELLPGLDCVTLSSSHGEGLPNAIGEAMARGLPVVATKVGDAATLIGDGGFTVPARDPTALADAWIRLATLDPQARTALAERGRNRIAEHYSLATMVARYEALYASLAEGGARSRRA